MKDKYLHTFRRQPDPAFADDLFQQIEQLPLEEPSSSPHTRRTPIGKRRLTWAMAILIAAILVMAMAPSVRARLADIVKQIGGLTVLITEDYPGAGSTPRVVEPDITTLEEARARVDYAFNLPDYIPEGLTLQVDNIIASNIGSTIRLTWEDEDQPGRVLILSVQEADPDVRFVVGPNSITEVMVNDQSATLIRGGWYQETETWQNDGSRMLRWELNGVEYTLQSGNEEWGGLSDEELIQIAESISAP